MTAKIITQYEVNLPPEMEGITEDNFTGLLRWQRDSAELSNRITKRFKPTVCALSGFSDLNRPGEKTLGEVKMGELTFQVTTTPTKKRISYSQLDGAFGMYIGHLLEQHEESIRETGIITIDGHAYAPVPVLMEKINKWKSELLEGKDGVKQEVVLVSPPELAAETPQTLSIVLERDYSQGSEYHGRVFIGAVNMKEEGDGRAKKFKGIVLQDTLQTLGGKPGNPVALLYPFERYSFLHQVEPRKPVKHGEVIDAFVKPMPKKVTRRSRFGDFAKIEGLYREPDFEEFLREKGLIDDAFMQDYRPRQRDGAAYIQLEGVKGRLDRYRSELVSPTIEQNFSVILR